ncbi:MAG: Gfo/Idh/MocA family oxidoreductase [Planctomycetaceae bacterium]
MSESRRDFLKTASVTAVGAGLLGSISRSAYAAGDDTINIALIGCGGRGRGAAEQALSTNGKVKLIAVADAFRDQLDGALQTIQRSVAKNETAMVDVPEERKFVGFDAYKQVLALPDVDVILLATPPGFRPIHFAAAVEAGKHVFMEKPVATDAGGVRQVLAAAEVAKQKNLKVGVGLQRHHQACYQDIIGKIHAGEIGDVLATRVYWNGGGVWEPRRTREQCKTEMEYQMRSWYYYNWLCGDHICEQHIHNLDVGCWVKNDYPIKANGMGGRQVRTDKRYGEIFDHHAVEYTFADGSVMISQCRHIPGTWSSVSEHVHGTKGMADLSGNARSCRIVKPSGTYQFDGDTKTPYQVEHDDLFHAIRNDISYSEAENGAKSTMVSILGRMCTYSGKELSWDQAINSKISIMPKEYSFDAETPTNPDPVTGEYPIPVPGKTKVV